MTSWRVEWTILYFFQMSLMLDEGTDFVVNIYLKLNVAHKSESEINWGSEHRPRSRQI